MNYAQKYNEALEKARKVYDDISPENSSIKKILEKAFPELRDSEDERIREAAIEFVRQNKSFNYYLGIRKEQVIAWLEKQDNTDFEFFENGENEKREFVGYGFLKCKGDFLSFKEGETYWLEYVGKDNYNVRSDNLLGQTFHITPQQLYTVFRPTTWLEKQDESIKIKKGKNYLCTKTHKYAGVEWIEGVKYYSPEDYSLVNQGCICYCPKYSKEEHNNFFKEVEYDGWLEKQGEQKPAEWSKEDELHIRELESLVKQAWATAELENNKETIHKMSDLSFFLKTLKSQLKREWSKEDEEMIEGLNNCLDELEEDNGWYYVYVNNKNIKLNKVRNWLKSLKPQNHITDEELTQAKKDAYNDTLDKIEYHSGELTFDDGWSAAIKCLYMED